MYFLSQISSRTNLSLSLPKLLSLVFARSSSLLLCHSFDLFLFPASIKSMRLATMPSRSTWSHGCESFPPPLPPPPAVTLLRFCRWNERSSLTLIRIALSVTPNSHLSHFWITGVRLSIYLFLSFLYACIYPLSLSPCHSLSWTGQKKTVCVSTTRAWWHVWAWRVDLWSVSMWDTRRMGSIASMRSLLSRWEEVVERERERNTTNRWL